MTQSITKPCPRDKKNPLHPRKHSMKRLVDGQGREFLACEKCGTCHFGSFEPLFDINKEI